MKRILKFFWWFVLFTMLQIVSQSFGLKKVSPTERLSTFIGQSTRVQFFFVVISYILFAILTASLTLIFASDQVWVWPDTKWYNNFKQWSRDLRFRCMITKYFRLPFIIGSWHWPARAGTLYAILHLFTFSLLLQYLNF